MSGLRHRVRFVRDHRWAPDHMSDYLDGELASGGRVRMERHLGDCRECRKVLMGLRGMLDALSLLAARYDGPDAVQIASAVSLRLKEPPSSG